MPDYFAPPGGRPEREYPVSEPTITPDNAAIAARIRYGYAEALRMEAERNSPNPVIRERARRLDRIFKRPGGKR